MVSIKTRANLSQTHLQNAELFRDKASTIEAVFGDDDAPPAPKRKRADHKAYCFNAIISTISFLDATANQFVDDLEEDSTKIEQGNDPLFYPDINQQFRDDIVTAPNRENRFRKASPPIKFNVLLDIIGKDEFDRDSSPMEPVLALNRLRQELTHYSPEWVKGGPKDHTENEYGFEKDLQDRFDLNPLMAPGNAFFPDQCMSYGCTRWAVRHARALVTHFGRRIDVDIRSLL